MHFILLSRSVAIFCSSCFNGNRLGCTLHLVSGLLKAIWGCKTTNLSTVGKTSSGDSVWMRLPSSLRYSSFSSRLSAAPSTAPRLQRPRSRLTRSGVCSKAAAGSSTMGLERSERRIRWRQSAAAKRGTDRSELDDRSSSIRFVRPLQPRRHHFNLFTDMQMQVQLSGKIHVYLSFSFELFIRVDSSQ